MVLHNKLNLAPFLSRLCLSASLPCCFSPSFIVVWTDALASSPQVKTLSAEVLTCLANMHMIESAD